MARFSSQSGGGNPDLNLIRTSLWNYPTNNGVVIRTAANGESIAVKSTQSAALRWHIREGGSFVGTFSIEAVSIIEQSGEMGVGPYQAKFSINQLDFVLPIGYYYQVNTEAGSPWDGNYIATAATNNTLTLEYPGPDLPGANEEFLGGTIYVPSVYNQVETNEDGVWIKNANWSAGQASYSHYWNFKTNGSVQFPSNYSNARTGFGEVLQFGNSSAQSIITGPATTGTAQRLVVAGQDGAIASNGEGGDIYLWAGQGGTDNGSGGDIKVDGGAGAGAGEGGTIKIRGGYSPSGTGGFVHIEAGSGGTAGGDIQLTTYNSAPITISGAGGEFLNNSSVPGNQIATISDIGTAEIFYSTSNGAGTNYKVGDDAWIGDVNASNTISIKGVEDATTGYILFGSSTRALGSDATEVLTYGGVPVVSKVTVPSTATSTGVPGQIAADADYIYVCTDTDTWKRSPLSTW